MFCKHYFPLSPDMPINQLTTNVGQEIKQGWTYYHPKGEQIDEEVKNSDIGEGQETSRENWDRESYKMQVPLGYNIEETIVAQGVKIG